MKDLQIFKNQEFGEMRTTRVDNMPYICLADVCKILDVGNVSQLKTRLNQDGVITNEVTDRLGRKQQATFINESNLYKVVFQSRKPEAEKFTEWVTDEVLPSIRRTGGYIAGEENMTEEELVLKAMDVLNKKVESLKQKNRQLEVKVEEQEPKVLFASSVEASKTSILIGELAKIIKQNGHDIGQNRLFEWLRQNGYLISRQGTDYNTPTQRAMNLGLFEVKETSITHSDGHVSISKTTKVTGKGQVYFINKFLKEKNTRRHTNNLKGG